MSTKTPIDHSNLGHIASIADQLNTVGHVSKPRPVLVTCSVCYGRFYDRYYLGPFSFCRECRPCDNCQKPVGKRTTLRVPLSTNIKEGHLPVWVPWTCSCLNLFQNGRDDTETLFFLIMNSDVCPTEVYAYVRSDVPILDSEKVLDCFDDWASSKITCLKSMSRPVLLRDHKHQEELVLALHHILHINIKPARR
jgi:hypothetical protein